MCSSARQDARTIFLARESTAVADNAIFGSYLFANNTRVGIMAFATGLFFGLPTVLLQFYNGIMIGTISAIFMRDDLAITYLTWILPHGVPELTAITLCSAAGLCLGRAVAAPRPTNTRQSFTARRPRRTSTFPRKRSALFRGRVDREFYSRIGTRDGPTCCGCRIRHRPPLGNCLLCSKTRCARFESGRLDRRSDSRRCRVKPASGGAVAKLHITIQGGGRGLARQDIQN